MAKTVYSERALSDLERLKDFLLEVDSPAAPATIKLITEAITILERHPFIGRALDESIRELVISRGKSGSVDLYSYEAEYDAALILAIRHQREARSPLGITDFP